MSACNPTELLNSDFRKLTQSQLEAVKTRLMYKISRSTDSVQQVMNSANCLGCDPQTLKAIQTELLCRIANL